MSILFNGCKAQRRSNQSYQSKAWLLASKSIQRTGIKREGIVSNMADITLDDLLKDKKTGVPLSSDEDILTYIDQSLDRIEGIAEKAEKIKKNPLLMKHLGARMERLGIMRSQGSQSPPDESAPPTPKSVDPEKVVSTICEALSTIKTMKGDITISELETHLKKNKKTVAKLIGDRTDELTK